MSRKGRLDRPIVVQHSFGELGSGGPIGALDRILNSELAGRYEFVRMHQERTAGTIDVTRLRSWVRMLREVRPDVVHIRGLGNEGFHGVLAARLARCPRILLSIHGTVRDLSGAPTLKHRVLRSGLEPASLRMATHVTTVCHFASRRSFLAPYAQKMVGPLTNGVVIVEPDAQARAVTRSELDLSDHDVAVITVGRLSQEKGHQDLAAALRGMSPDLLKRIVLLLVGDGPQRLEIERDYSIPGLRLRSLGMRLDVPRLLQAADVFAFPSWHENLSNALLEAMAAGLPVVATEVGGNTEVVERGGGILVPARNSDEITSALMLLVESPRKRAEMGAAARQVIRQHYSMDRMVQVTDDVYQTVLGNVVL